MKSDKNILIAFVLNLLFSLFELFGGLFTNSIAILSDSVHDLGDALSIGISYLLERKSKNKADYKYTYGYVRFSVMGSIITTTVLLVGSIFVIYESIKRLFNPVVINYNDMMIFAVFGVFVNSLAVYFTRDDKSLNQKSVNLHLLEDVFGWMIVLIGAIIMKFTNLPYIDSLLSIGVASCILILALKNVKVVVDLFLEKIPDNINLDEMKKELIGIRGVSDVHHIHIRSIDGYNNYATLHVVVKKYNSNIKSKVRDVLNKNNINHSTIELELIDEDCHNEECDSHIEHHHHHHH